MSGSVKGCSHLMPKIVRDRDIEGIALSIGLDLETDIAIEIHAQLKRIFLSTIVSTKENFPAICMHVHPSADCKRGELEIDAIGNVNPLVAAAREGLAENTGSKTHPALECAVMCTPTVVSVSIA